MPAADDRLASSSNPALPSLPPIIKRRYLDDPHIATAIQAGDLFLAQELAKRCIDARFDDEGVVEIVQAVEEFRAIIRHQGRAIRADDETVARWLGLG